MSFKIESLEIKNYGNIESFKCDSFSNINLVIGENATGKTFLLKALYSAIRSMEDYRRGDDVRSMNDILSEKLRWTFQVDKLGDIVRRGAEEALSLFSVILKSREVDRAFGFDDTYYDLAKALRIAPSKGRNYTAFAKARKELKNVINGKVDYDEDSGKWYYRSETGQKFSIGATAEGVKKISIMDRLFANGYISRESVLFIDELESALHPDAICEFLEMLAEISREMGIQIFISTHSYFVIKKLALIAMKNPGEVTCISLAKDREPQVTDLSGGMPENSIIQTSIDLYRQEVLEVL